MLCPRCRFENPEGSAFCGQCGTPLSMPDVEKISMAGERRFVTVVFVCIPGLLTLSERLDPDDASRLIQGCIEVLSAIIYKHGGTPHKFFGQELMAIFGALEVREDDAVRALRAALEMSQALQRFSQANEASLPEPLAAHCGVNTGLVFAGEVGVLGLRAFTVIGDTINLASRLAYLAGPGQVFLSEATYRQTQRLFRFRPLPPLGVRGRLEPVPAYLLLGPQEEHWQAWGLGGLSSPMVGREREFAALQDRLRRLGEGKGGIVLVIAEAGLGKSRLVTEVRSAVAEPRWLEGRGLSFHSEQPYFPFRDLIQRHLSLEEGTAPSEARDRLREMVTRFLPGREEQVYPFLSYLLGLPPDDESVQVSELLSGEGLRRGFFRSIWMLLAAMAQDHPTVVVIEDLHWVDESSLELLTYLTPLALEVPILFIFVWRPEIETEGLKRLRQEMPGTNACFEIRLAPLTQEESVTLLSNLLQMDYLLPILGHLVLEKAEGNPLFVEEIIRSLIQDGVLVEREGRWQIVREVGAIQIPDTLRGLLASRIDRLEPEVRETLRRAAVIGRIFPESVLAAVLEDDHALTEHLQRLLERHFIHLYRLEGVQGKAYIFNHALTHEAAYESILRDERRRLHYRVLEEMERLYADRLEAHAAILARHAYLGEAWEKAAYYLHLAGDQAKAAYALPEAVRCYQRALGLVQEHGVQLDRVRLADLCHECCSAQAQLGNYADARRVCSVLMEMGDRQRDPYLRGHALRGAALIATYTGDTEALLSSARAACRELEAAHADWSRGTALFLLALGLFKSGQLDEASAAIQEGLRLVGDARRWPGYDPQSEALFYAGLIAMVRGRLEEAVSILERGEARAQRTGEYTIMGLCMSFASLTYGFLGHYAPALEKARSGVQVGEGMELPPIVYTASVCAAWVHALAGHYGAAIHWASAAITEKKISTDARAIAYVALGDAYLGLLDVEAGLAHHQKALETAGLTHIVTATAMRGIGLAYVLLGQMEQGMTALNNALAITAALGLEWFRAQTLRDLARAYLFLKEPSAALECTAQLLAVAESNGYRELLGWGHLLRGIGAGDEGEICRAIEVGRDLGSFTLRWEAAEALVRLTGDEKAREVARTALWAIADDLPEGERDAFLNRERVRSFLEEGAGADRQG